MRDTDPSPARRTQDGPSALIAVGRIGAPVGVHGETYVEPWTDAPQQRFAAGSLLDTDPESLGPLSVESLRLQGQRLVVHFRGVDDRSAATALRATTLLIRADSRPQLSDPDEFYDTDLEGLLAVGVEGGELGVILQVVHLAATDYLLIRVDGVDRLVPFVSAIVPEVDVANGRVVIDAPEGLFEL